MNISDRQITTLKWLTIGSLALFGLTVAASFVVPTRGIVLDVVAMLMQLSFLALFVLGVTSVIIGWKRDRTVLLAGVVGVLIAALGGAFLIAYLVTD